MSVERPSACITILRVLSHINTLNVPTKKADTVFYAIHIAVLNNDFKHNQEELINNTFTIFTVSFLYRATMYLKSYGL
jgi:hypothetical protein